MREIWVPVSGAIAQQKNIDTIANNVANANTPGFKKDQVVFKEYLTALEKGIEDIDLPRKEWKPDDFYRSYGAEHAYVNVDGSYTRFEQGRLTPTNNPLDIALMGQGMFEILTDNGVRYTRKGTFTISNDGFLVTENGHHVLSKLNVEDISNRSPASEGPLPNPQDRKIQLNGQRAEINQKGEVFVAGNKVSDLSITEFKNPSLLKKEGNSAFINPDITNIDTNSKTTVHQGFIEESNVNAITEMSELIKASRHFESIQQAIKAYDSMAGKGSNEIGKL